MLFIAISTNYVFDTMSRIALVTHSPLTSTSVSTGSPLSSPTATLTTGPEMHALHIASYHRAMMQKAAESIDLVASSRRDISAVTMLAGPGGMARLKTMIQRFRRELLEMAVAEQHATQVVQINFQIFPLSVAPDQEPKA